MKMWFEALTGIPEHSPDQVRSQLQLEGNTIHSLANGRSFTHGKLETPSLKELRDLTPSLPGTLHVREAIGDVTEFHRDPNNAGAFFQVASQFNLLEMIDPDRKPEDGIGIYSHDRTQGPACAIAAGAGTIYRNYLVEVQGQVGQSEYKQIDCLADLGKALGNIGERLWKMQNGYVLAKQAGLEEVAATLQNASEQKKDELRQLLRIGVHAHTQVTLGDAEHLITQAYCSALPVGYSHLDKSLWQDFAQLVLEAAYEATLCAAAINAKETGTPTAYLTLLGGGAFGNDPDWIFSAIHRAIHLFQDQALDLVFISYSGSNPHIRALTT